MALIRYAPTYGLSVKKDSFQDLVDSFFDFGWNGLGIERDFIPAMESAEDEDGFHVRFELPGMKREDISIDVAEGVLRVSGERKDERIKKEGGLYRSERAYGRFSRSIRLPSWADAEKAKAILKDGVLELSLPRSPESRPRKIEVK
jgi:HSP20 family protein